MATSQSPRLARLLGGSAASFVALVIALASPLPAQEARFTLKPMQAPPGPGTQTFGLVGWRSSPRLMSMVNELGVERTPYRRMIRLYDPLADRYIGEDFQAAEAQGLTSLLTCVGTPKSLSPEPDADQNQYATGVPEYARYPPTDPVAWADALLAVIDDMEVRYGVVPDYVEIWNEPERVEWFKGTGNDLLELYAAAAGRIRSVRPEIRIGGPGLAGWRSEMGTGESVLLALVRQANALHAPLDFVSWHHYATSTELQYSKIPQQVQQLNASLGGGALQTIVSEWNIYPSAEGAAGHEFDGPHAAANLGGFLISARMAGLDHGLFFQDLDEPDNPLVNDLMGTGVGLLSQHGVKKPSARLLRILQTMAVQAAPTIVSPVDEWNVRVTSSIQDNAVRIVVTNDVISGLWVFANRARDHGMDPAWLYPIWIAAGGTQADEQDLIDAGLTQEQAQATLSFIPEVRLFDRFSREARPVVVEILGGLDFSLDAVTRFTLTVNAPAQYQAILQPAFVAAEDAAALSAAQAAAIYLTNSGYPYSAADILAIPGDFFEWAVIEGIPYGIAVIANKLIQDTLRSERLAQQTLLNNLPETVVVSESAASAGVWSVNDEIWCKIEPNTSMVIDITLKNMLADH